MAETSEPVMENLIGIRAKNFSENFLISINSVQLSCSVVSDSLQPCGLLHARPPCPSPTHGVYSNSCPLSWWCHPAISSSVVPFSSWPQSLPTRFIFYYSFNFISIYSATAFQDTAFFLPLSRWEDSLFVFWNNNLDRISPSTLFKWSSKIPLQASVFSSVTQRIRTYL